MEKLSAEEKRQQIRYFHDEKLPEETPAKTKTGLISILKNKDNFKNVFTSRKRK